MIWGYPHFWKHPYNDLTNWQDHPPNLWYLVYVTCQMFFWRKAYETRGENSRSYVFFLLESVFLTLQVDALMFVDCTTNRWKLPTGSVFLSGIWWFCFLQFWLFLSRGPFALGNCCSSSKECWRFCGASRIPQLWNHLCHVVRLSAWYKNRSILVCPQFWYILVNLQIDIGYISEFHILTSFCFFKDSSSYLFTYNHSYCFNICPCWPLPWICVFLWRPFMAPQGNYEQPARSWRNFVSMSSVGDLGSRNSTRSFTVIHGWLMKKQRPFCSRNVCIIWD